MHGSNISVQVIAWTWCRSGSAALTVGVWVSSVLLGLCWVPHSFAGSFSGCLSLHHICVSLPWSMPGLYLIALVCAGCALVCYTGASLSSAGQARDLLWQVGHCLSLSSCWHLSFLWGQHYGLVFMGCGVSRQRCLLPMMSAVWDAPLDGLCIGFLLLADG